MLWNAKNGTLSLGNAKMRYVSFGRGERILVLLPGLSDGLATVEGKALLLAPPYRRFFKNWTVYMFSRREELPEGATVQDMAEDQIRALETLGIRRACVVGVSQGGMIAQAMAAAHPERVEKLVLAVTAPRADEGVRDCVEGWIRLAERGEHRKLMIDTAERSYSEKTLRGYRLLYPILGMVGRPKSYRRFLINARAILSFDMSRELDRIVCPTLILGGEADRIVGAQGSAALHAGIAGSELHLYPGLSHAAYEEAPDFWERVRCFLEKKTEKGKEQTPC
jgi:pimeloyl-ACP methyl ester carboxylesterase